MGENMDMGFEEIEQMPHNPEVDILKQTQAVNNFKQMFVSSPTKRFDAAGGLHQQIMLNPFAIRKQIDVKRLKLQLWEHMEQRLKKIRLEPKQPEGADIVMEDQRPIKMSNVLSNLQEDQNVSIHSAFICLLHLANEKGLSFDQTGYNESDFNIKSC